ncbi:MAG: transcription termination/antitermination protein NusG [Planctomycetaceae bacterium]
MPVLTKERAVLPDDLFESPRLADLKNSRWCVIHTRPRAEKTLARHLSVVGTPFFLPLFQRTRRRQRRTTTSWLPLFPGYLFVLADDSQRDWLFTTNLVANCLTVDDQLRLDDELQRVHELMESGEPLSPEDRLELGMAAEIIGGPLKGHRGTVIRRGSSLRFVLEVDFLQRGASVEVEGSLIRQI